MSLYVRGQGPVGKSVMMKSGCEQLRTLICTLVSSNITTTGSVPCSLLVEICLDLDGARYILHLQVENNQN